MSKPEDVQAVDIATSDSVAELSGVITLDNGDRIIPAEHLGKCPFHELSRESFGSSLWSIARGGRPVPDGTWTICIFQRDEQGVVSSLSQDRWILPDCFSLLFDHFERCGDQNRIREVCRALGIHRVSKS